MHKYNRETDCQKNLSNYLRYLKIDCESTCIQNLYGVLIRLDTEAPEEKRHI